MSTHGGWLDDVDVWVEGQLPLPDVTDDGSHNDQVLRDHAERHTSPQRRSA